MFIARHEHLRASTSSTTMPTCDDMSMSPALKFADAFREGIISKFESLQLSIRTLLCCDVLIVQSLQANATQSG